MVTIHVVSHTHWDREWHAPFQRFRFQLVELIDQLLELLDANRDYRYFLLDGQAIVLEDYLEMRPEQEKTIRRYVQEGRLLIGPWYVLPDEFLISPEATVRNLMMGERVCRRFGSKMEIGYLPDSFGHIGQMPQILRGFGIDVACLWRGVGDHPTELHWRGPDSSQVLLLHMRDSYSNGAWLPVDKAGFVHGLVESRDSLIPYATTSHILIMQGTDHMRPRADLPRLLAAADAQLKDTHVVHSTLPRYLAAVRDELEEHETQLSTIHGELRSPERAHLLPGVLSTRTWIKQRNHACETVLEKWAEPFSAIAACLHNEVSPGDQSRPGTGTKSQGASSNLKPFVNRAWRYLLENHPHDSICGCSVDQVHREMITRFDWCEQIGQEVARCALQTITNQIATSATGIVVFNPAGIPRTDPVRAEVEALTQAGQPLLDAAGRPVPYRTLTRRQQQLFSTQVDQEGFALLLDRFRSTGGQIDSQLTFHRAEVTIEGDTARVQLIVSRQEGIDPGPLNQALEQAQALLADESIQRYHVRVLEEKVSILFVARDVPPLGYTTYTLDTGDKKQGASTGEVPSPSIQPSALSMENALFLVQVNPENGTLDVTDKTSGRTLRGCHRFVDGGDRGDEYNYCQPKQDYQVDRPDPSPIIRLLAADEVGATIEIAQTYQVPASLDPRDRTRRSDEMTPLRIVTHVALTPGVHRVDFETTVENQARDHRLRVHFPTDLRVNAACADGHFDFVERSLNPPSETEAWAEQPAPTHPQRAFVDVSDGAHGVMLANRGLPEYEVLPREDGAEIALTLLRCVGWLSRDDMHCRADHAGPGMAVPEAQCPGRHTFRYSLIPHTGDHHQAYALAYDFQTDLRAISIGERPSPPVASRATGLPDTLSFVAVEPATLEISAIKEPENGEGLIVRCWNTGSKPVEDTVRLWRPFRRAVRVNLAEKEQATLARDADAVTLTVGGRQVVTIKFEF